MTYQLEMSHVAKHYHDFVAVDDVSLQIEKGEIVSLLGASGCGKTTTLRMIAGLIHPTRGTILIEGKDMTGVPPYERDLSMVFQNYALFPHLTVFENIVYGLRMRKIRDREVLREKAREMMKIVQLRDVENRLPRELSGGQQQRVSLARAMIVEPKVMLFDEPLSNLDAKLREQTRVEIRSLLKRMNVTAIYVTHDQEEALTISDRVAVMHKGKIEQITAPRELYTRPQTRYIADFVGHANVITGTVSAVTSDSVTIVSGGGHTFTAPSAAREIRMGETVSYIVRPEYIRPVGESADGENTVSAKVLSVIYLGARTRFLLDTGEEKPFEMDLVSDTAEGFGTGDTIRVHCDRERLVLV